jgi:hypothetical protein
VGGVIRFWLVALLALLFNRADAHAVAVDMDALIEGQQLVVLMNGPGGQPINGAKLEYVLFNGAGQTYRAALPQVADGEYRSATPPASVGQYTLVLRDTTFPGEALEAQQTVRYPLVKPVRLVLPPSKAGAPSVPILIVLTLAPIGLSLLVLLFILFSRPKIKPSEAASSTVTAQPLEEAK